MYKIGEQVRIKTGPFASFTGKVEETSEETGTLKVAVDILARTTTIELTLAEVEKSDAPKRPWPDSSNN
jgi:transcriptional antiterminator NusG